MSLLLDSTYVAESTARLLGLRVAVTGGTSGLGLALVRQLHREGAKVAFVARNAERVQQVARENPGTHGVVGDIASKDDIYPIAMQVTASLGGLDVLINNASALGPVPLPLLLDYPADDFRRVLDTNLLAPFLLIQKLLPALLERGGAILNVTSDAGVIGYPGWGAYGISKFGIEGLSQTWAAELDGSGVRVHWIDPGSMDTDMHRAAEPDEDPAQWADPADVTGVFVFLASDAARGLAGRRWRAQEDEWEQPGDVVSATA